jgi:hypothetical protein
MNMRLFALLSVLLAFPVFAAELEGVKLDDEVRAGAQALQLNGIALRTRFFFKVYVAGLYLPQKTQSAQAALEMPGPKRMTLVMLRDVGRTAFSEALLESFKESNGDLGLSLFKPRVDALLEILYGTGDAKTGTRIVFDFVPGTGTVLTVDGSSRGKPVPGDDFSAALLRIWIGEGSVADNVKKALLGAP